MSEIRGAAPAGYGELLAELKQRIQNALLRDSLAVNRELVLLYWQIGREVLTRQQCESWGTKVVDRLAELKSAYPEMKGFSPRSLKYMRAFAEAWPEEAFCAAGCTNTVVPPFQHVFCWTRLRYVRAQSSYMGEPR